MSCLQLDSCYTLSQVLSQLSHKDGVLHENFHNSFREIRHLFNSFGNVLLCSHLLRVYFNHIDSADSLVSFQFCMHWENHLLLFFMVLPVALQQ
uniref:Uncharacterized protein n=1 Tax=Cairina moschata TaxID=8855 RepID=A0A8C3BMF1_CAIMO